jgi:hypothetical protein
VASWYKVLINSQDFPKYVGVGLLFWEYLCHEYKMGDDIHMTDVIGLSPKICVFQMKKGSNFLWDMHGCQYDLQMVLGKSSETTVVEAFSFCLVFDNAEIYV